jgi:hypothetical protein
MLTNRIKRDTSSLSNRIDLINNPTLGKLSISDTSTMLTNRIKRDTANLSRRVDSLISPTLGRLKISDTSAMLSSRIGRDTLNLSKRLDSIINPTLGRLKISDTAALSARILSSAAKEVTYEHTATASQSVFTLTVAPSPNSKIKMYINGVRISNKAYGYVTNSGGGTTSSTPTIYIKYTASLNGNYDLLAEDRIQMDYYY